MNRVGETVDTGLNLAGGVKARLVTTVLPGPCLSASLNILSPVPVYLTRREGNPAGRMEVRMLNGTMYWGQDSSGYMQTDSARGARELRPLARLENDQRPMYIVFTDDGSPSAVIIAGYIGPGSSGYCPYDMTGFQQRPSVRSPEQAMLALAQVREANLGRR